MRPRQILGPVQKVKGCEVVWATVIILATSARPVHDPGILTRCRLARLNIHVIGVQPGVARDGDYASQVGAKIVAARREAELIGDGLELTPGAGVKGALRLGVVGDGLLKSKAWDNLDMMGTPEADDGQARRTALFHPSGLARAPAGLSL